MLAGICVSGCVSSSSGTPAIAKQNVDAIQKGVTTRADIESKFGPPTSVTIRPDGGRALIYSSMQIQSSTNAVSLVLPFVPGQSSSTVRQQTLTVVVNGSNVVTDYEFSDGASKTDMTSGFAPHTETAQVPTDSSMK
jgi:hypothetical protein